jgi:hypothetical protein
VKFPPIPTVHGSSTKRAWREPREGETFRTCFYCGSIENEDLLRVLETGAKCQVADQKYGWPHKIYVDFANPRSAESVKIGSQSWFEDGKMLSKPIIGKRGGFHTKYYTEHLMDEGYDEEALAKLTGAIATNAQVKFTFKNVDGKRKLWWDERAAP